MEKCAMQIAIKKCYICKNCVMQSLSKLLPVWIRVRIDPPHPLVCRERRLNDETEKNRGPVSQQVWHHKDPSLLKGPERRA
jgi:hypothetical protein